MARPIAASASNSPFMRGKAASLRYPRRQDLVGPAAVMSQATSRARPPMCRSRYRRASIPRGPSSPLDSLTLDEQWQPAPSSNFKAGDAIVRTITRAAADVPGMAMLELSFTAPPGVRVYVDPPQSDDQVSRGAVTGRRTDRVTLRVRGRRIVRYPRGGNLVGPVREPSPARSRWRCHDRGISGAGYGIAVGAHRALDIRGRHRIGNGDARNMDLAARQEVAGRPSLPLGGFRAESLRRSQGLLSAKQAGDYLWRICRVATASAAAGGGRGARRGDRSRAVCWRLGRPIGPKRLPRKLRGCAIRRSGKGR